jgi:ribonuclease BN (tRNA processing enzyme)
MVNNQYLFEAPPQALMSVQKAGVDPNDLKAVIISHHHGDHFYGLPMLMLWWKWKGRTKPIRIIGPRDTEEITRTIASKTYPWLFDLTYDIEWVVAEPGTSMAVDGIQIETFPMIHDDMLDNCLGFACEINGRRLGYTGDTTYCDSVEDLARWSEVLVAECASVDGQVPIHMNLRDDIPRVRKLMPASSQLILTHIDSAVAASNPAGIIIAEEYKKYCL